MYLSEMIRDLSKEYDAPMFQPHCTLYSPVTDLEKAKDVLDSMELHPITVTKTGIGQSDVIWKTVFIKLQNSGELSTLQRDIVSKISAPNPTPYSFFPHISLIYKKMPAEDKASIIRKLDMKDSYVMDKIAIVKTGDNVESWESAYAKGLKS